MKKPHSTRLGVLKEGNIKKGGVNPGNPGPRPEMIVPGQGQPPGQTPPPTKPPGERRQ
jgi:hypothetical protein